MTVSNDEILGSAFQCSLISSPDPVPRGRVDSEEDAC
jgi:hypothetical protein